MAGRGGNKVFQGRNGKDSGLWLSSCMQRERITIHRARDAVSRGGLGFVLGELSLKHLGNIRVAISRGLVQKQRGPPRLWRPGSRRSLHV